MCSISGTQSPGASAEVYASAKSSAPSLCRIRNRCPWCSIEYSTPCRRGAIEAGLGGRVVGRDDPHLAGDLAVRVDDDELLGPGQPDADPEPLVALLVDELRPRVAGVPTVCRHTRYGRHASSTVR